MPHSLSSDINQMSFGFLMQPDGVCLSHCVLPSDGDCKQGLQRMCTARLCMCVFVCVYFCIYLKEMKDSTFYFESLYSILSFSCKGWCLEGKNFNTSPNIQLFKNSPNILASQKKNVFESKVGTTQPGTHVYHVQQAMKTQGSSIDSTSIQSSREPFAISSSGAILYCTQIVFLQGEEKRFGLCWPRSDQKWCIAGETSREV